MTGCPSSADSATTLEEGMVEVKDEESCAAADEGEEAAEGCQVDD
jgi:hypothetical protein